MDGAIAASDSIATPMQSMCETAMTLKRQSPVPAALAMAIAAEEDDNTEYLGQEGVGGEHRREDQDGQCHVNEEHRCTKERVAARGLG